jgi:YidC/Oxa1 family membrane protein insertase
VTQLISTELMLQTQSDKAQKWLMRGMPIIFVFFLWNFPAGLFVYWITTNIWTIGQQLIIRRTMPKPEELAARKAAKPKKRSRFMEAVMQAQENRTEDREKLLAQKAGVDLDAKGGTTGKKPAAGGGQPAKKGGARPSGKPRGKGGKQNPPPGKGKRKPGQASDAKPKGGSGGQPGKKPGGPGGGSSQPSGDTGANTSGGGPAAE